MQLQARPTNNMDFLDDSDDEALDLFNKLNPNSDSISHPLSSNHQEPAEDEERPLGRLSKMKKDSKKDRKREKKKEKKLMKLKKKLEGMLEKPTPQKKSKKTKKMRLEDSGSEAEANNDAGSSQYSSESEHKEDVRNQLQNLNPDFVEEQDPTPKKRLKRSGRKERIEQKQGFRIDELGNEAKVDLDEIQKKYVDEDYSFDDIDTKKKRKNAKAKVKVPTNEEIMNKMKEQGGVVESQGEEKIANYDNGLDMLYAMKDKRKGLKISNRLFCDLEIDVRDEEVKKPPTETLELELKPRTSTQSSSRFTFMDKVETLKKQRGLEANVDMHHYEKKMEEKAKQSMAKAVSSMIQQDYHDDIELEVRVPTIARGKSADIINNAVFLKSFVRNKTEVQESPVKQTVAPISSMKNKKQSVSRQEFYRQIQEQSRNRKSKIISEEELINSFKKTNLGELEQARKRIQEKKRKEMLSENEDEDEDSEKRQMDSEENKIEEMIEKEEIICGDIEGAELDEEENKVEVEKEYAAIPEKKLEEVQFNVNVECEEQNEEAEDQEEQEINAENEVIDELASASEHIQQVQEESENEEGNEEEESQAQPSQPKELQQMQVEEVIPQLNEEDRQKMIEMEEEGIMMRKRKIGDQPQQQVEQSIKENIVDLPNKPEKIKSYLEDDEEEEFNNFRKLRKIAMVIAHKKKIREQGIKYASQFIENQAEEGSDNEQHDDMIKNIDYAAQDKEYQGMDLDADLVELIDNAVDLNQEDEQAAFRKYLEDIRLKDKEEIKKIIRGEFRTRNDDIDIDIDEDERKRQERMEEVMNWMKKRQEQEGAGIYLKQPQEEEVNSDDQHSQYSKMERKKKKEEEEAQSDGEKIPEEEEKAMIERFIEDTLPSVKKDYKPVKMIDLGPLPESARMDKSVNSKTISMTKLGSKHSEESKPTKLKRTSSLVNQILSRNSISRISQKTLSGKLGKK